MMLGLQPGGESLDGLLVGVQGEQLLYWLKWLPGPHLTVILLTNLVHVQFITSAFGVSQKVLVA